MHEILPASDPKSKVARGNIPQTCGACHGQKFVMASSGISSAPFLSYQESVHGKAVAAGSDKAAVCTDCHGEHEILAATDPKSPINKFNVPNTCAKCHADVQAGYVQVSTDRRSPRQLAGAGLYRLPRHSHHQGAQRPEFLGSYGECAATLAAPCQRSVSSRTSSAMPAGRVNSYLASYHGMASKMGSNVANCASCHGVHNILPSSDPGRPSIRPTSRRPAASAIPARTRSSSLQGTPDGLAKADFGSKVIGYISKFYILLIFGVIGGMVLHNFIILRKKLILHRIGQPRILFRMTVSQRMQHILLLVSFFTGAHRLRPALSVIVAGHYVRQ